MSNVSGCCPAEGMVGIIHLEKSTRVTIGSFRRKAPTKPVRLTTHWAFHARRSISKHASQTNHRELTVAHVFTIGGTCHYSNVIRGEFCPRRKNSANPEAILVNLE